VILTVYIVEVCYNNRGKPHQSINKYILSQFSFYETEVNLSGKYINE